VTSTPITRLVEASRGEEICEQGEVESWTAGRIDGRHHLLVEYVEIDVQPDLFQRPFVQPPVHAVGSVSNSEPQQLLRGVLRDRSVGDLVRCRRRQRLGSLSIAQLDHVVVVNQLRRQVWPVSQEFLASSRGEGESMPATEPRRAVLS
jgi:hypothetical protein